MIFVLVVVVFLQNHVPMAKSFPGGSNYDACMAIGQDGLKDLANEHLPVGNGETALVVDVQFACIPFEQQTHA